MRYLELRRHPDNDGDTLSPRGVAAAEEIGRTGVHPPYALFASTGAGRTIETAEILRHAAGQEDLTIMAAPGLRSAVEDRWREAAQAAGANADLEAIRRVDPDLVDTETRMLGLALQQILDAVPDGGRALIVGHSPTNEAAVLGLTGQLVGPLGKGDGVLVVDHDGRFEVSPLE
jgi:broad specificity phosphatase PhoE